MGSHRRPPLTCDASSLLNPDRQGSCGDLATVILAVDCPRHAEHAVRRPLCRTHHERLPGERWTTATCEPCFDSGEGYDAPVYFIRLPLSLTGRWRTRHRRVHPDTVDLLGRLTLLLGALLLTAVLVFPHIDSAAADVFGPSLLLLAAWGGILIERHQ